MFFKKNKYIVAYFLLAMTLMMQLSAGHCYKKRSKRCFTPMQVSVIAPVQTSPTYCDVNGVRLNLLYGKNRNVSGIDVGIVNHATGNMNGYEVGVVNYVEGDVNGAQKGLVNRCNNLRGGQDGWINICEGRATGIQTSYIYSKACDMTGVQFGGICSHAKRVRGVQLGLINVTNHLKGAQIGLLNIQTSRRCFKVLPILNISTTFAQNGQSRCYTRA